MSQIWKSLTLSLVTAIFAPVYVYAGVSLRLGDDVSAPSCPSDVAINLSGGDGIVAGAQVDILFPTAQFTFQSCTLASGVGGTVTAAVTTDIAPPAGMTRLRVIVQGSLYSDGTLATCQFQTASGAAQGAYSVTASRPVVSDSDGGQLGTAGLGGTITVGAPTSCCP